MSLSPISLTDFTVCIICMYMHNIIYSYNQEDAIINQNSSAPHSLIIPRVPRAGNLGDSPAMDRGTEMTCTLHEVHPSHTKATTTDI